MFYHRKTVSHLSHLKKFKLENNHVFKKESQNLHFRYVYKMLSEIFRFYDLSYYISFYFIINPFLCAYFFMSDELKK